MKVTNWRKQLAATLVACGLLTPTALRAADLNTNLVIDPSFENVDVGTVCCYNGAGVKLNSWNGGIVTGFAYGYVQEWDEGDPPPGAGDYFFAGGATDSTTNPPPITSPGEVAQNIAVGTGATGALIGSGEAAASVSSFFTSYNGQNHFGSVHVEFLNAGGTSLGSGVLRAQTPRPWHQERTAFFVPPGTATLKTSVFASAYNGYIDNVDVRVTNAVNELLFLEVNTVTGLTAIKNQTGEVIPIDYYRIRSASGRLNATAWNSLQEQNLPGFPAGSGSGNGWEQIGGSSSTVIGESFLTGNSSLANSGTIGIGQAFNVGAPGDLIFEYAVVPAVAQEGDFDADGDADGADFLAWQRGFGVATDATQGQGDADGDGDVDGDDFAQWRRDFGESAFQGAGQLARGFVRYVSGAGQATPEPSTVLLVGVGLGAAVLAGKRRKGGA